MKKLLTKTLTLILFALIFASIKKPVIAAPDSDPTIPGTYNCAWVGTPPVCVGSVCVPAIGTCRAGAKNCNTNFDIPDPNQCEGLSYEDCINSEPKCVSTLDPANTCAGQGGAPKIPPCRDGSYPIPVVDTSWPFVCCKVPNLADGECGEELAGHCTIFKCAYGELGGEPLCEWPLHCCANNSKGGGFYGGEELCNASGGKGIETAIGCLTVEKPENTANDLLIWSLGIGGGIAFLLIIYSGYLIIMSSGDPRKLQAGKELLAGAVSGLLLIVLSVFLLRFIGVDILGLSGLQ